MPIKIQVVAPGGSMLELTCENNKEVFKQLAFWSRLPQECPIDGMPTRLDYKSINDNDYYTVVSTGPIPWSAKVGQAKVGGALFFRGDGIWSYWDYDRNQEVTTREGDAPKPTPKAASVAESATPDIKGQGGETLMSGKDIDAVAEDEFPAEMPDDFFEDDPFVKGLIDVAEKKGYNRNTLVAISVRDYNQKDLNKLDVAQLTELSKKLKAVKPKGA